MQRPQLMHCGLEKCVAADGSVEGSPPTARCASIPICRPLPTATRLLSLTPACRPSPTHSQERFQREGAKCLFGTSTAWKSLRTKNCRIKRRAERIDRVGAGGVCKYIQRLPRELVCVIV